MQWLRVITMSYVSPTGSRGAKIHIVDQASNKRVTLSRDYEFTAEDQFFKYLADKNINVVGRGYLKDDLIIMTNDLNEV